MPYIVFYTTRVVFFFSVVYVVVVIVVMRQKRFCEINGRRYDQDNRISEFIFISFSTYRSLSLEIVVFVFGIICSICHLVGIQTVKRR